LQARPIVALALALAVSCTAPVGAAAHYEHGERAAEAGDWETAKNEFVAARDHRDARERAAEAKDKLARQRLDALVALADAAYAAGYLDQAIDLLRRAGTYREADLRAAELEGTRNVLEVVYGQMVANAADGRWEKALEQSGLILGVLRRYRDAGAKRAEYLERIYATAARAESGGDLIEAIRLFTTLGNAEPGYRDVADRVSRARAATRRPLPGVYAMHHDLRRTPQWEVTLGAVRVQADGRITVFVDRRTSSRTGTRLPPRRPPRRAP
jgi:tetratricopeptide (TPR) repeat protein